MPGQNASIRYGFMRAEGVPGPMPHFPKWASEEVTMDRPNEPDPNIDASGNETEGENLKAEGSWSISGAPDSESYVPMRAHQHGFYEQSSPAGGVHLYTLRDFDRINDDPVPHYIKSLGIGVWRDIVAAPSEYSAWEAKVASFKVTAQANQYVMFEHSGLFLRDTYMAAPAEVAVNVAYTGGWERRGHRQKGDETGRDVFFRISTGGAVGVAKRQYGDGTTVTLTSAGLVATAVSDVPHGLTTGDEVTVVGATQVEYNVVDEPVTVVNATTFTYAFAGSATSPATGTISAALYGATEHLIVDDWMDAYDAEGLTKGTRSEPVQTRPTMETGDVFTVGDSWRMAPTSPQPVAAGSVLGKLKATELELEFAFGGGAAVRKVIQGFTFEMLTPWEFGEGVGSKYHQSVDPPENAKRGWEVTFDRELKDLDFERARINNTRVSAYAKFYGKRIGATAFEDFAEYYIEASTVTNAGGTITGPGKTPEQGTLRAYPASPGASLCVEKYQNTVASIDPT